MNKRDKFLGMDRPITRRDFLQGVAVGLAATKLAHGEVSPPQEPSMPSEYPPLLGKLRGQDPVSMASGHRVRDDDFRKLPADIVDTGEDYDLVVVGAGFAGLAAAYVYNRETNGRPRMLLLDTCDDFGGHARRNTFTVNGTKLIAPGGVFALEGGDASGPAGEILSELGVDTDRMKAFRDPDFRTRFKLSPAVFFDPKHYPGIRPTWLTGFHGERRYEEIFAEAPIPDEAKRELIELYTTHKNYLPDDPDPRKTLGEMSWETFIREKMGLGDHAVRFANLYATDLGGLGCDAVSARFGFGNGPGFAGMGGDGFFEKDGILQYGYGTLYRYPDGSHTIARQLLKRILPEAVPGHDSMEGAFNSRIQYDQFDRPEKPVRLRLRSTVVRVEHVGESSKAKRVAVHYLGPDGRVSRVTAKGVVVAAWGMAVKHIVPELPPEQFKALEDYRYCSEIYINVALRNWKPIAEIGAFEMFLPDGYCTWMHVNDPLHVGEYKPDFHPDKPTLLNMYKYIHQPGLDPEEQMVLGRTELETKTFEEHEKDIRSALNHVLGPWGFNAAEDILGLTINRWGHGYVYANSYQGASKFSRRERNYPQVEGRAQLGRISFAGADAAGNPWTQAAFAQAHRAAMEQRELS